MRSLKSTFIAWKPLVVLTGILSCTTINLNTQTVPQKAIPPALPKAFSNPQKAAEALIKAAENFNVSSLLEILGPDGEDIISSADPVHDKSLAAAFAAKAHEKTLVTVDAKNKNRAILLVGNNDWPVPIPIVQQKGNWHFDSKEGRNEILFRRIGANELDAIQICRRYVEAQEEYASQAHDGINQYAQRVISSPGKRDGLYWQNQDGSPGGPIGEAVARAIEEGYSTGSRSGYHGYYFKVLKGQGPAARLGQLDYVVHGIMIGGFALVAVPAEYRVTGVKTFMVSYDGIVYEKDLGPDSVNLGKSMNTYNPDKGWHRTDDQWPTDVLVSTNE